MVALWHTGHKINYTVMTAVKRGIMADDPTKDYPIKLPQQYRGERENISYGILRGVDVIYRASDTYWELDRGYFKPSHFDGYYRISRNNTRAAYNEKIARTLSNDRLDKLGIKISEWNYNPDGFVLICPPTEHVMAFFNIPSDWVKVRKDWLESNGVACKIRDKNLGSKALREDLRGAKCVLTYNSNISLEALALGIPAVAESPDISLWNHATYRDIVENQDKLLGDRELLFRFLSYCQFTLDEFASGKAWKLTKGIQA